MPSNRSPDSGRQRRGLQAAHTLLRCLGPLALIIVATTWPLSRFQDHAHWSQVEWVPFTRYQRPFDIVANLLLFVPLGLAFAWKAEASRVGRATLVAFLVTLAVETGQVFTHNRAATVTDLMTNTTGAWLGARLATRSRRGRLSASAAES